MMHFGEIYGHAVGTCFMHVRLENENHPTYAAFWGDLWTCCRDLLHACPLSITALMGVWGVHKTKINISITILERATAQHVFFWGVEYDIFNKDV